MAVICDDALRHPDFPHSAFITYWVIATYAAGAGKANPGECRVKQETLAERAGIPVRTLRNHLKALTGAGFVHSKETGRSSILTVTGDRCGNRIPIGGLPKRAARTLTPRQAGYEIADAVDEYGTNFRQEGLSDLERHMVASAAGKAIEAGMSHDDAHDSVMEHMGEVPLLPTTSDLLDIRPVSEAPAPRPWRYAPEPAVRSTWSGACKAHADRPQECTRDCVSDAAPLAS